MEDTTGNGAKTRNSLEIASALAQSRADRAAGRAVQESAAAHLERLEAMLNMPSEPGSKAKPQSSEKRQ
jgi:hypothetical protein